MAELIEPLFRAIHPDFSFDYGSLAEYERVWRETPTVDAGYLDGPFRETLQMYREHNRRYKSGVKKVNQVDGQQNPWR